MESAKTIDSTSKSLVNLPSGKVKMFIHKSPVDAETAVNQWLTENKVRVNFISQSQSEKGGNFLFVLSLYYIISEDNY